LRRLRAHGAEAERGAGAAPAPQAESAQARSAGASLAHQTPRTGAGLSLPPARVAALLVVVFLGFGVLMGHVARTRSDDVPAAERSALKLVVPASPSTSTQTASTQPFAETPAEQPATSEPETTPAPAAAPAKSTAKPTGKAKANANAGGSGGSEGGSGAGGSEPTAGTPDKKLPSIKHVFVIMLSDEPYSSVFGPSSPAHYLAGTLVHRGELLPAFHAVAHEELADELALVSGQGPTAETAANCPKYAELVSTGVGPDEAVLGSGCVYPSSTQTLPGELEAKHLKWRAYIQGIDEAGASAGACAHPALGASDPGAEQSASTGPYATFRNPFVYLGSIVGSPSCASDDVGLPGLKGDLANAKLTPSFSYIAPDRCHDGNPTPCTPGAPAGPGDVESFLEQVVPEITGSKAYKEDGLLVITTDEAPSSGALAESSSCCGEPLFPNDPTKTLTGAPGGGGIVGALLLSPFVKAGSTSQEQYNDFSLLSTIEDLFSLRHIGYTALPTVKAFEPEMFVSR
jgi:hypothetical protein